MRASPVEWRKSLTHNIVRTHGDSKAGTRSGHLWRPRTAFPTLPSHRTHHVTISAPRSNRIRALALSATALPILLATLTPENGAPRPDVSILCVLCGDIGGPDLILNVLLFLPFGCALGWSGLRPLRALGVGLALSVIIEAIQLVLPGRAPTLRDVLCNGAGAGLGALIALRLGSWVVPSPGAAARLWTAVGGAIAVVTTTGVLQAIEPSGTPWFAHWSARQEHLEHWSGRVLAAEVDGRPVPPGRLDAAEVLRDSVRDGARVRITAIAGTPTRRLGGILTISDRAMNEILLIGPVGDDLIVRLRRRAASFRFAAPEVRFPGALATTVPGTPLELQVSIAPAATCVTSDQAPPRCVGRPATASAWTLYQPLTGLPATARILLDAVTLGLLAFPTGLLLRSVATAHAVAAALVLAVGVAGGADASGLATPSPAEWAGLVVGLVAGLLIGRLVAGSADGAAPAPAP